MDISPDDIDLVKAALNDSCYILVDFNNGCRYHRKFDKIDIKPNVRIGARIAVASGIAGKILADLPEESLDVYCFDKVMKEIFNRRFKQLLKAVIIHINEYQIYIDHIQRAENISWEDARDHFKAMLNEIGSFMSNQFKEKSEQSEQSKHEFFIIPICTGTSAIDLHFLHRI